MSDTKIEWCDVTWNPVTGCAKVSKGCQFCYAERVFDRMAKNPKTPVYHGRKFTDVQVHPERLGDPLRWKKPRRVFVNSMSDLFHEDVPDEFIDQVFQTMGACEDRDLKHTFLILTKRPERMRDYMRTRAYKAYNDMRIAGEVFPPPNVGLGVSIEDQQTANERISILVEIWAALLWVSYEPALGGVDLSPWLGNTVGYEYRPGVSTSPDRFTVGRGIRWLVCGGESGPNARPSHPDWFRLVRDQCKAANVPFFFKQWGEWADDNDVDVSGLRPGWYDSHTDVLDGGVMMRRVGKKAAGRLLDGVEHNEFPAAER